VDRDDWNTFLGRFELRGDIYGKGGCVELSTFYVKPTSFLAGDLAFLAVIMGKEDFSSSWCNWCKW
jgi:hypothetical protein